MIEFQRINSIKINDDSRGIMQTSDIAVDLFDQLRASADQASQLMKAMANTDRLMLLCQLSQGEKSVSELETNLNLRQPSLSQQLTVLREAQLVSTRREGKNVYYSIGSPAALAVIQVLHREFCQKPALCQQTATAQLKSA
jgi:DNA-binding transcriptional ArsR family regulator